MKRTVACDHLRSLRYFCARSSTTALLSAPALSTQSSYVRNRLLHSFASDAVSVGNGLMDPSLFTRMHRSLSTQSGIRTRSEIVDAFRAATGAAEALESLKDLEAEFGENDLIIGDACLKISMIMVTEGMDPENILTFSTRACNIFNHKNEPSWPLAVALLYTASMHYKMKNFDEALGCVDRVNRVLYDMQINDGNGGISDRRVMQGVQLGLAEVETDMGRTEEALHNMRQSLELKQSIVDPNSRQYGDAHHDLAKAYVAVPNLEEALPLALKALEIHQSQLGSNSVEGAYDRLLLSDIYDKLGDHQKALEQTEMAKKVLKNLGRDPNLLHAEINVAKMQIALERFDEAINTLESVVQQDDSETRAFILILRAKAFCAQENFADFKKCLEISCSIFETSGPVTATRGYLEIALLYETMDEVEIAVSFHKKVLSLFDKLPQRLHPIKGSIYVRIGWLLLSLRKTSQAVPYLESGVEMIKERKGEKIFDLGFIYKILGTAYLELERPESAAQVFALAKDIMYAALGPHHPDSIESLQNLALAYGAMGRYGLAIEFQQRVVDVWESHGPTAKDDLREAQRLLEKLKGNAQDGLPTESIPPVCDISFFK